MVDKREETLEELLKSLRICLNFLFLYSKDHRSFTKSAQELKKAFDKMFNYADSITIGFSPDSLYIEGKSYKKALLYQELAKLFHLRKIKSISFSKGISVDELTELFSKICLPPKEILKSGGISKVLDKGKTRHLLVEDLDYSLLLKDEGEEIQDIWSFLIGDAVDKNNLKKIDEFADNFEVNISKLKARNIVENQELNRNLTKFLLYLKNKNKDKFLHCSKSILKLILRDKSISTDQQLNQIAGFFKDLPEESLANTLWEELSTDERFDSYSFQLFFRLLKQDTHERIAASLTKNVEKSLASGTSLQMGNRIKELFTESDSSLVSEVYRRVFSSLVEGISPEANFVFDQKILEANYRGVLLNLLAGEKTQQRLGLILEKILQKWKEITAEKSLEYLKCLLEVLEGRKKDIPSVDAYKEFDQRFANFIENVAWEQNLPSGFEYFISFLQKSVLGPEFYLQKIFREGKINPSVLKLFFRFFPEQLDSFYENLGKKSSDIDWLASAIENIRTIEPGLAIKILKYIYSIANDLGRIEVLRAMEGLYEYDREFLFGVLKEGNSFLKQEALLVLMKNEADRKEALEILFCFPNPWGKQNIILLENIGIIDELDLKAARQYLVSLGKKPFFWDRSVRNKARKVLERWDVR